MIVNFAQNKFDSNGKLIDEDIRDIEARLGNLIRPICIYLLIDLAFSIARNRDIIV